VDKQRSTKATLELSLDSEREGEADAPAGALVTADGRRRAFCGWIELASAIEDWRQTNEQTDQHSDGRR
jgi:hypothetical protein